MTIQKKIILSLLALCSLSFVVFLNFRPIVQARPSYPCLAESRPWFLAAKDKLILAEAENNCHLSLNPAVMRKTLIKIFPDKADFFNGIYDVEALQWEGTELAKTEIERLEIDHRAVINIPKPLGCNGERYNENGADGAIGIQSLHPTLAALNGGIFPLKNHQTCVKNQKNRGTCVSFATTAAVETMVSFMTQQKTNLSEQHFYGKAKLEWTNNDFMTDGLIAYNNYVKAGAENYTFTPGYVWKYNPSPARVTASWASSTGSSGQYLAYSCNSYPGASAMNIAFCSDTNHQGKIISCPIGVPYNQSFASCTYSVNTGIAFSNAHPLPTLKNNYMIASNASGIALASHVLRILKKPIVGGFAVTNQLNNPVNGIVEVTTASEPILGGHAVSIIGVINNNELPPSIPNGQGGGYFIIKNSLGYSWGLKGYGLISFQYFLNYGSDFNVLEVEVPPALKRMSCSINCHSGSSQTSFADVITDENGCRSLLQQKKALYVSNMCSQLGSGSHKYSCEAKWDNKTTNTMEQTVNCPMAVIKATISK